MSLHTGYVAICGYVQLQARPERQGKRSTMKSALLSRIRFSLHIVLVYQPSVSATELIHLTAETFCKVKYWSLTEHKITDRQLTRQQQLHRQQLRKSPIMNYCNLHLLQSKIVDWVNNGPHESWSWISLCAPRFSYLFHVLDNTVHRQNER